MANLASVIMEGSGFNSTSVDLGSYDYSDSVVEESSYVNSAIATLFTDIMESEQGYMVTDVVGAATAIREMTSGNFVDTSAILEASISGAIEKIKNAFRKFIAKIKEYYHKVVNWFKAMFSNAESFVNNFGPQIKDKSRKTKGFKYNGFKYTLDAGDSEVLRLRGKIEKKMQSLIGGFDFMKNSPTKAEFKEAVLKNLSETYDSEAEESVSEYVDKIIDGLGYDDTSDLTDELYKKYRDDSTVKVEIKDFEGNSADSMLKFLKDSKTTIGKLEDHVNKYEEKVKSVISKLDTASKWEKGKGEENAKANESLAANASWISSMMTGLLNLYKVPCNVEINVKKAVSKEWLSALKKFYNFKPAKESVEVFDDEAYATLENYIILEGEGKDDDDDEEVNESYGSDIADILDLASKYRF